MMCESHAMRLHRMTGTVIEITDLIIVVVGDALATRSSGRRGNEGTRHGGDEEAEGEKKSRGDGEGSDGSSRTGRTTHNPQQINVCLSVSISACYRAFSVLCILRV